MLKKFLLLIVFLTSISTYCQDYYSQFVELFQKKYDSQNIKNLLETWKNKDSNDAKYYIAGFNFYWNESKQELLHLDTKGGDSENLVLKDSLNKTAGYLYSEKTYNDSLFTISQNFLVEGLKKHPKRLDMIFGKIYALGEVKKYNQFTEEIIAVILKSKQNNLDWLWEDDKPIEDKVNFFKGSIQDYQNTLYYAKEDANMKKVAIEMANYFPEDEIILSTLGTCYLIENNYQEALKFFKKATNLNPKDGIILNNLGETYLKMNDTENAKKYFKIMSELEDKEMQNYAIEKLNKIK